eukprot:SAG31_NODE_77_length_27533_cov_47.448859_24_plen_566_part_00
MFAAPFSKEVGLRAKKEWEQSQAKGFGQTEDNPLAGESTRVSADPLKHRSGMFLRWDPNDKATASQGQAAWDDLLTNFYSLPPVDEGGVPQQQLAMTTFDGNDHPFEASPMVTPRAGHQLTPERLTNMLRGEKYLTAAQSVLTADVKTLALQGVLSQTFKVTVTYSGEPDLPDVFIAKFLSPAPTFAFTRMVMGGTGMGAFRLEDWMYNNDFFRKAGCRQPECYFSSHDPVRETFCLLMEDLNTEFSGGDQLSGGPGADEPHHHLGNLEVIEAMATFNAKTFNKTRTAWEGQVLVPDLIGNFKIPFFQTVWPAVTMGLLEPCKAVMDAAGVIPASDPRWQKMAYMTEHQVRWFEALDCLKEQGGFYNACIAHGDARSENIFFPLSRKGTPAFIDFQLCKEITPAFDAFYWMWWSCKKQWRLANELEYINVYYDSLREKVGSVADDYTWEVFLFEWVTVCPFFIFAMEFFTPELGEALQQDPNSEGYDARKVELLTEMSRRSVDCMTEWILDKDPAQFIKFLEDLKDESPKGTSWAKGACAQWVPEKFLNGRDPSFYEKFKNNPDR